MAAVAEVAGLSPNPLIIYLERPLRKQSVESLPTARFCDRSG